MQMFSVMDRREEEWKNGKKNRKEKQGRNRDGKMYTPQNLMWPLFTLNLGSSYACMRAHLSSEPHI